MLLQRLLWDVRGVRVSVVNESAIFSFMYYFNTGPLRTLILWTRLSPWHTDILYIWHIDFLFHLPLLQWQLFILKYIIHPRGPCEAALPSNNHSLISNCLFLRIIPNGLQSPFPLWAGIRAVWRPCSSCMCPQQLVQFWFEEGDWGIYLYVMTQKYNGAVSPPWPRQFAVQSSASCNPVYLHPLALCTQPSTTRTCREISIG